MTSTVTTPPNHYEVLGLAPGASADEIKAAFAREIGRPRAFGGLLDVSVAFEALRDPAKRRAYNESIGLAVPKPSAMGLDRFSMALPAIHVGPPPRAEPIEAPKAPEPKIASFIASSVRAVGAPNPSAPRHDPPPVFTAPNLAVQQARVPEAEPPAMDLKRPAVAVGALVAVVALIGAWAGVTAGSEADTQASQRAVTVALPKATAARPVQAEAETVPAVDYGQAARRPGTARPAKSAPPTAAPITMEALTTATLAEAPVSAVADPLAPTPAEAAPAVAPVAASMPLNNATIARTIGRIGYACGAVSASEAIGGGAFKITCTSGQSYRAAPIHGRYRFKRL